MTPNTPLYEFLFPIVSGGNARALVCRVETEHGECSKVLRTRIGMVMHLKRVHGIEIQLPLLGGSK